MLLKTVVVWGKGGIVVLSIPHLGVFMPTASDKPRTYVETEILGANIRIYADMLEYAITKL